MTEEEFEMVKGSVEILAQGITKVLETFAEGLKRIFDELPPYLKFEYTHPRKKPRGSLRRARKEKKQGDSELETWEGIHAQVTAPKGTFDKIWNEAEDNDEI